MSCGINPYSGGRGLPQSLLADGKRVRINTGFRRWLHFWRVMSAPELTCFEQRSIALINTFGALPADAAGAMREALWFYRCGRGNLLRSFGRAAARLGRGLALHLGRFQALCRASISTAGSCTGGALWHCLKACPGKAESNGGFGFDRWILQRSETPVCGRNTAG